MDKSQFDTLTRAFAIARSRRSLTRLFGGLTLGAPLVLLGGNATAAKKKGRKRKKSPRSQCTPQCTGKQCGPDGCGQVCGSCLGQQVCDGAGLCCRPNCFDRVCGPDGCGGSCGRCPLGGQICNRGACECPADKQVLCGGACVAPCIGVAVRNPNTCECCLPSNQLRTGSERCCSGVERFDGYCMGLPTRSACTFDAECHFENQCNAGRCDPCFSVTDFCRTGDSTNHTCNGGDALCLRTVDNRTRCGVRNRNVACNGCSTDLDCLIELGQGSGAFCVVDTGAYCDCPDGQTFCAVPR